MSGKMDVKKALELCGFISGDRQQSRLMNLLSVILKLQSDPPIPLSFGEIYDQLLKEEPEAKLTKAWVHRVLKSLVEAQLVRLESPNSRRKKYIADVNTVMAGLEQLKSERIKELESQKAEIDQNLEMVSGLECGDLAEKLVVQETGTEQKISSRIVRGVEELHRVLKYNMLDVAKKGDTIRAILLWAPQFMDAGAIERSQRFLEAAMRGAEVRYLLSVDIFRIEELTEVKFNEKGAATFIQGLMEVRKQGIKFDVRIYVGPRTYHQVSFNNENMALIITENPVTATWITRDFNPDLIDNAIKSFDKAWKKAKSLLDMKPEEMIAFGADPKGLISRVFSTSGRDKSG